MIRKISSSEQGPSWTEVILGAALSAALGLILGAAYLVLKPVTVVRELPKEPVGGAIYYIEGARDSGRATELAAKRKAFAAGQAVTVSEGELNSLVPPVPAPAAAPGAAPAGPWLQPGTLNVRLRDGLVQLAAPAQIRLLGMEQKVIVQARGTFRRQGDGLAFVPAVILLGGCPVQRLPGVGHWVVAHLLLPQSVPADLVAGWAKATDAVVDGASLRLTMP